MSQRATRSRPHPAARDAADVPPESPWFAAGLRFACTQCGACCTGAPGHVWVDDPEVARLAAWLGLDIATFERRYVRRIAERHSLRERANGDCVFFDAQSHGCHVYGARPVQCRTWPFWPENLATPVAWDRAESGCPGMGEGPLVGLAAIRGRLRRG